MLRLISAETMGHGRHGWLDSQFHFSFAEYYNPENINFGVLRVLNDDIVQPGTGFDTHPHDNMEIITYVLEGEISHADSMGNKGILERGEVQYMSAGTGITHSEHNYGEAPLRLFQMWIYPDKNGYTPNYGDYRFVWDDRIDKWLSIATNVTNTGSTAPVRIHQDANVYAAYITAGNTLLFEVGPKRQAYLAVAEGVASINGTTVNARDALEVIEEDLVVEALENTHIVVIEMAKE